MSKNVSWNDRTTAQKAAIIIAGVVQTSLAVLAYRDLRRRPAALVRGSKPLWYVLCSVNFIGPLAYFGYGRLRAPSI